MKIAVLSSDRIKEFVSYCARYGKDHDESYLPDGSFVPNEDNPTYILLNDADKIIGTASLIMDEGYRKAGKARFRVIHCIEPDIEKYRILIDAVEKHAEGLDNVFLFLQGERVKVSEIIASLGYELQRYSWYLERHSDGVPRPDFPEDYQIRKLDWEKDGQAWCDIVNTCFPATHPAHVDLTDKSLEEFRREEEHIEKGILMLWHKDKPIGTVRITRDNDGIDDIAFISYVAIMPEYQGKGLGRKILRAAVHTGKSLDMHRAGLFVNSQNLKAADLYISEGFKKLECYLCYNKKLK